MFSEKICGYQDAYPILSEAYIAQPYNTGFAVVRLELAMVLSMHTHVTGWVLSSIA